MQGLVAQFIAEGMQQVKQLSQQVAGQGPDPLVKLKEQELQIRAQSEQADAQVDQAKLNLEAQGQRRPGRSVPTAVGEPRAADRGSYRCCHAA